MDNAGVNKKRRRFLVAATSVVGGAGLVGVAIPFLGSWQPSAKAKAAGAPVKVNLDKVEKGQQVVVAWQGKPVFVVRRTDEMLENIRKLDDRVRDPNSDEAIQPDYAKNEFRSMKGHEHIFVVIGICTHLGCSPKFVPHVGPMDFDANWVGGYHCPCHGSKFDMAGRVFKGVPAPTNLEVPPYSYITGANGSEQIVVGIDEADKEQS